MSTVRWRVLAHHSRNRLMALAGRLAAEGRMDDVAEIQAIAEDWTHEMARTQAESDEALMYQEVDLIDFVADLQRHVHRYGPTHLHTHVSSDWSACAFSIGIFDRQQIRCVLGDALDNAWRHAQHTVRVHAACDGAGYLLFTISDDGPGFPEAWLSPQPDTSMPAPQGTGQGLVLARRVAARHQHGGRCGELHLRNEGGAILSLRLP